MKKHLEEIADVRVGYQFRGKVTADPHGAVRVVQIKDVDSDLRIRVDDLTPVAVDRAEPYLIRREDVLFLGRGHRLYGTVVPDVPPNTIATGYFFILRADPAVIVPEYFAWALNQREFQEALRPFHRGSHMPMISRTDLAALAVQVPPLSVQREILHLNQLLAEELRLMEAIGRHRSRLVEAVSQQLMHMPHRHRSDHHAQ
jgi:hypothetical protein